MPEQLLDRQVRLLEHLTTSAGVFGAGRGISNDPGLSGLDLGLLHLEARFSHEKRMQKIEWVLTKTFELMGHSRDAIIREFVEQCPPVSISWLDNARQFHQFLEATWLHKTPEPAFLPDIAAYELAYAKVRAREDVNTHSAEVAPSAREAIRRNPRVELLCCCFDIKPILQGGQGPALRRDTRLVVAPQAEAEEPVVAELSSDLFALLEMLDQFVEPSLFADVPEAAKLIDSLTALGLIEVQR